MSTPSTGSEYGEQLRKWQHDILVYLGWNPEEVVSLMDDFRGHDWPSVSYRAVALQSDPSVGHSEPYCVQGDGETTYWSGRVILDDQQAADLIATVGPKPELMTREQELILKGMLYEDEHS